MEMPAGVEWKEMQTDLISFAGAVAVAAALKVVWALRAWRTAEMPLLVEIRRYRCLHLMLGVVIVVCSVGKKRSSLTLFALLVVVEKIAP